MRYASLTFFAMNNGGAAEDVSTRFTSPLATEDLSEAFMPWRIENPEAWGWPESTYGKQGERISDRTPPDTTACKVYGWDGDYPDQGKRLTDDGELATDEFQPSSGDESFTLTDVARQTLDMDTPRETLSMDGP
jgi:hypothetical protein